MTTLGKYIGGGMSFGAFGGKRSLMELYDPRRADALPHAGTFNNNVLTMHAGVAGLEEVFTAEAADRLFNLGEALRARLNAAAAGRGAALRWSGLGSLMSPHFARGPVRRPADSAAADPRLRELLFLDMLERGFYLARRGMVALSLEVGAAELDGFTAAFEDWLDARARVLAG
jgi:glutamate-1-semialdehyde 2,1-aminomutase